jgi:Co/Zn/Cd efflux system component
VFVNAAVAALKLTVGFVFNSVELVADGFDSLVDVSSAIAVFLGIKHKRELISASFIIFMIFGTAGYIGYESISRLISPEPIETTALTILAAIVSGGVCYAMSVYQHYIGRRSGSISLLSQSVDSRNHAFQAAAVLIGLIFAAFGIFLVDSVVALLVAGLILKSAIELMIETSRMAKGEELDTTRFGREYEQAVNRQRRHFFKTWLLLNLKEINSRDDIIARYHYVFAPDDLPIVTVINPVAGFDFLDQFDTVMEELSNDGLVTIQGDLFHLTEKGRRTSSRRLGRARFGIPF